MHLLQAPVFAFAGDRKGHLAFARAGLAFVVVANLRDDGAGKGEGFGFDGSDRAFYSDEIAALPAFLFAFYKQHAVLFGDGRRAEVLPTDPLQRKFVLAEQFGFSGFVFDDGFGLRVEWEGERAEKQ